MQNDLNDHKPKEDEWGIPPAPDTPENRNKIFKAQMILGIVALIFISLPAIVIWLVRR